MDILSDSYIESLKERILEFPGVVDPKTQHHIFASGMHGRKCDLDAIPDDDQLLWDLTEASVAKMKQIYPSMPDMIITIANGGNRFKTPLKDYVGNAVSIRTTTKDPTNKDILLNERTEKSLQRTFPEFVVIWDDLGTTGLSASKVARKVIALSNCELKVFTPVYRRDQMEQLQAIDVSHDGLIRISDDLPTYTKRECEEAHYCKQGQQPIPHGQ